MVRLEISLWDLNQECSVWLADQREKPASWSRSDLPNKS